MTIDLSDGRWVRLRLQQQWADRTVVAGAAAGSLTSRLRYDATRRKLTAATTFLPKSELSAINEPTT